MEIPNAYVIEDQASLSTLYSDALRLVGYTVQVFRHGYEAINYFELNELTPHLIILDINLPGASGVDILKHIRRRDHLKETPVMVVTANTVMASKIRPELGEHDTLFIKPLGMQDLQDFARKVRPSHIKTRRLPQLRDADASPDARRDRYDAKKEANSTGTTPQTSADEDTQPSAPQKPESSGE